MSDTAFTWQTLTPRERLGVGATKLAVRQLGGAEDTDAVLGRTQELLADPDIEDAAWCDDCHVLIPFLDDCYPIDSSAVCLPCGVKRELPDDWRMHYERAAGEGQQ
jgi:hypothetical protein